jgi:uncharacterized alkaline shock family protein YloU
MLPNQRAVRVTQENGELLIAKKVLTSIVYREAREMPGVVELGGLSIWKRIARWLGFGLGPRGVRVDLGEGEIGVVLTLVVKYGVDIPELSRSLRARISDAVRSMTGLEVRCVDINIASVRIDRALERPALEDASAEAARRFGFEEPTFAPPAEEHDRR